MDNCTVGFIVWTVGFCAVVGIAVFITKSAMPLWALLLITGFSCKDKKCMVDDTPVYETMDAETGQPFEYVKVKDLK